MFLIKQNLNYFHILAMEIIAEAIENSELVIICMSDSYKRDNHCQAQAEYALISKRILLPLVVHDGYKPDGWLNSIISNNNYIDIGKYDFKMASELLLKELKQRQPRNNIIDVKQTVLTPVDIVRNPSGTINVSDKPYIPVESSALNGATNTSMSSFLPVNINRQQQAPMNFTLLSSPSGTIFSVSPVIVVKQQQQQAPIQSVTTSSVPDSFPSDASMPVNKQQEPTAPMHSIPKPSTPVSFISGTPMTVNKQQQLTTPMHPISKPSIPEVASSTTSISEVPSSTTSITDIPQLEVPGQSASRSSTPTSASSGPTVINLKQEKPKLVQPDLGLFMPATGASATSTVINKQQQQTAIRPVSRSATPAIGASTAPVVINQQPPQESVHSAIKSSTSNIIASDASVNIEKKQQQQQPMNSVTQSPSTSAVPSVTFADVVQKQQQQQPMNSVSKSTSTSTVPFGIFTDVVQKQQQQQPMNSVSKSTSTSSVFFSTFTDVVQKQEQQRTRPPSNSRSTTPATLPVTSQTNGREQSRLPDKYTDRKTNNSIYRNISINAWRDNDVLDYLFDLHLYPMMPLCETMSGKALIRLFRMCQKKPSRVYDQLNEELRIRFNGLTLSMGVYTQFLIEMDSLVGPTIDALPPIFSPASNIVERFIIMPSDSPKSISIQPSPRSSTRSSKSSETSKTTKSIETAPETPTLDSARIVERAVYRTASNGGRPYNFTVESVEEANMSHDQVQRYGNQLHSLDGRARDHREINSYR